jgi:hypothetical protein
MGGKIGKALESTWKSTTSIMLVVLISTGDVGKESPNAAIQAFSAAFYIRPARASELRMPRGAQAAEQGREYRLGKANAHVTDKFSRLRGVQGIHSNIDSTPKCIIKCTAGGGAEKQLMGSNTGR